MSVSRASRAIDRPAARKRLVDNYNQLLAGVAVAGQGEGFRRALAQRPERRRLAEVAGLDHDQRVGERHVEHRGHCRREVARARLHPDGALASEQSDGAGLVGKPRRIAGDDVAVEPDELERVRRIVDDTRRRRFRALGDQPRVRAIEQNSNNTRRQALQRAFDLAGLDRGHARLRISTPAPAPPGS